MRCYTTTIPAKLSRTYLRRFENICISQVAQWVKTHLQCRRCRRCGFDPWVRKIFLEEDMATHSNILAWRIPWQRRLAAYGPQFTKTCVFVTWLKSQSIHACRSSAGFSRYKCRLCLGTFLWRSLGYIIPLLEAWKIMMCDKYNQWNAKHLVQENSPGTANSGQWSSHS